MALKKILLATIIATGVSTTTPTFASTTTAIQGDNNNLIYQITNIKGKALIELPNGKRYVAKPGMKIAHGSKITVLEKGVVRGFDIQNQCEVEYRECVNRTLHQNQLCARLTAADLRPNIIKHVPQTVAAAPSMSPTYVVPLAGAGSIGLGSSLAPYLLGLGGSALLAAVITNDDEDNISITNTNDNDNGNDIDIDNDNNPVSP